MNPAKGDLLKIYDTSALSLNKKQSSTYTKYACGCFLYAPSICIVYFKKAYGKGHLLCHYFQKRWQGDTLFVAAHKLILNTSEPPRGKFKN